MVEYTLSDDQVIVVMGLLIANKKAMLEAKRFDYSEYYDTICNSLAREFITAHRGEDMDEVYARAKLATNRFSK